jgi:hypothetical protein
MPSITILLRKTMPHIAPAAIDRALKTYTTTITNLRTQGVRNEGNLRAAFAALLRDLAKAAKWTLIEEYAQRIGTKSIYYDGVLCDEWRLPHGYWEAKDGHDDIVSSVMFSPVLNSKRQEAISGSWDGTVKIWDIDSGDVQETLGLIILYCMYAILQKCYSIYILSVYIYIYIYTYVYIYVCIYMCVW